MKRIFKKKARDGQDFCVAKKAENTPATEPWTDTRSHLRTWKKEKVPT
jgi:hypothetical protein